MSHATAAPLEAVQPDPDRAASARLDPAGAGKLLRVLQPLISYGRNLVETLRRNDYPETFPWYGFLATIFGTTDPAEITLIVLRGLLRIAALQARLSNILPLPLRQGDAGRGTGEWARGSRLNQRAGRRTPARPNPCVPSWLTPQGWADGDPSLNQSSPEEEIFAEILAEDQNRDIAPILLDICRDLGIVAALTDPATWDQLIHDLTLFGADPTALIAHSADVENAAGPAALNAVAEAHAAAGPLAFTPLGDPILTSPPWLAPAEKPPPLAED